MSYRENELDETQNVILTYCKAFASYVKECLLIYLDKFEYHKWQHFCITVAFTPTTSETFGKVALKGYLQGKLAQTGLTSITSQLYATNAICRFVSETFEKNYATVLGPATVNLGQEADSLGGSFDPYQAFSGKMADFNIWSSTLSDTDIADVYNCKSAKLKEGDVLNMIEPLSLRWTISETNISKEMCRNTVINTNDVSSNSKFALLTTSASYYQALHFCTIMGGELPLADNPENFMAKWTVIHTEFLAILPTDTRSVCTAQDLTQVKYWAGFRLDTNTDYWYDPYTMTNATTSMQDIIFRENEGDCSFLFGPDLEDWRCVDPFPCAACQVPQNIRYYLKGICKDGTR